MKCYAGKKEGRQGVRGEKNIIIPKSFLCYTITRDEALCCESITMSALFKQTQCDINQCEFKFKIEIATTKLNFCSIFKSFKHLIVK